MVIRIAFDMLAVLDFKQLTSVCALQVEERIATRAAARVAKDFAAADGVRQELAQLGIMLMDTPQGTTWRPGLPEGSE